VSGLCRGRESTQSCEVEAMGLGPARSVQSLEACATYLKCYQWTEVVMGC